MWFIVIGRGGADHWWKRMKRREAFIDSTVMEGADLNKKSLAQGFWGFSCFLWYDYLRERPHIVMLWVE